MRAPAFRDAPAASYAYDSRQQKAFVLSSVTLRKRLFGYFEALFLFLFCLVFLLRDYFNGLYRDSFSTQT